MPRPILIAFSILLSLLSACVKAPPKSAGQAPSRQVADAAQTKEIVLALEEISRAQAGLGYLSTYAQVKLERGKQSRSFDAVIQVAPPDRFSLQILNDLGQEIASVIADGKTVAFHDAQNGETRSFPQDGEALPRTLKLPFRVEDLVDRLLLRLPPSEILGVFIENEAGELPAPWVSRRDDEVRLDLPGPHLRFYEAKLNEKAWRYRVDYSGYALVGNREFPHRIVIGFRKPSLKLSLSLQQIAFSPPGSRSVESSFQTESP